jgi:hypothetical protein
MWGINAIPTRCQCGTDAVQTRCRRGTGVALTGFVWVLRGVACSSIGPQVCVRVRLCALVCARAHAHVRACVWNERVRVHVVCEGASVRVLNMCVCVRARVCLRACACVRVCPCTRGFVSAHVRVRVFVHFLRVACARVCVRRVCGCSESVCAPRRCARTLVARRRLAAFIARPATRFAAARAWLRWLPSAELARVGRRYHLDKLHGQRAMGSANCTHVRDRRCRRHLRHRRPRRQHHRHLLPGRVGEH